MTNFLNRVAGRGLGVIPLAQPLLRARFDSAVEKSVRPENFAEDHMGTSAEHDFAAPDHNSIRVHGATSVPNGMARFKEPALYPAIQSSALHPPLMDEVHSSRSSFQEAEASTVTPQTGQRLHTMQRNAEPFPAPQAAAQPESFRADTQRNPHGAFGSRIDGRITGPIHGQHPIPSTVSSQSSPSAVPVVRITIGRIDVRAELPSPSVPATRRSRSSALSLDQFLKQQSGAGQ